MSPFRLSPIRFQRIASWTLDKMGHRFSNPFCPKSKAQYMAVFLELPRAEFSETCQVTFQSTSMSFLARLDLRSPPMPWQNAWRAYLRVQAEPDRVMVINRVTNELAELSWFNSTNPANSRLLKASPN